MIPGTFTLDDSDDIVTLSPNHPERVETSGWINIGAHAVLLRLDANGGLCIQSHAKGQEGQVLASLHVPRLAATLARLRAEADNRADPLQAFAADLENLGFGTDDSISGSETVDTVNKHFDNLRTLADPFAQTEGGYE